MFASLSFKKFRRRLRAITLFKKFGKKSNKKQNLKASSSAGDVEQVAPVVDPVSRPERELPSVPTLEASFAETPLLPTPIKVDKRPVETIPSVQEAPSASENGDVTTPQNKSPSSEPKRSPVEELPQKTEILTPGPLIEDLKESDLAPSDLNQPVVSAGHVVAQGQETASLPIVEETLQDKETPEEAREKGVDEDLKEPEVLEQGTSSVVVEVQAQAAEIARQEPENGVAQKVDNDILFPSAVDIRAPESPSIERTEVQSPVKRIPDSPPQTPRSTDSVRVRTPSTPRKRIASEVPENQDSSIMSELQASVRSREKRRLEKEQAEVEKKERLERELRQSVRATMGREVTEHGVWKPEAPVDEETTIREVRLWRKQREASLKGTVDEIAIAKAAALREALSDEKIMVDLMSTVQKRASRAPACFVDPREKRQTMMLEDLFARRVQVG